MKIKIEKLEKELEREMKRPSFFDIFGIIAWVLIITIAIWMLYSTQKLPNWVGYILLIISIIGLIIDGNIVYKTYLIKK